MIVTLQRCIETNARYALSAQAGRQRARGETCALLGTYAPPKSTNARKVARFWGLTPHPSPQTRENMRALRFERSSRSSAHTSHNLVSKYHHATLSCLRQSRRRQTSLALKAPRAFNLSKLGAPNCFRAHNAALKQVVARRVVRPPTWVNLPRIS